jgi:CDP-glucose 4,6-dehydratase
MLAALGASSDWREQQAMHPREALRLSVDSSAARRALDWSDKLSSAAAIEWTASWHAAHQRGEDVRAVCRDQIRAYEALLRAAEPVREAAG